MNEEHYKIIKQGVDVWNAWRKENPGIEPDLFEADLREVDLRTADLNMTNLSMSDLNRADLNRTILHGTNLSDANLGNADLSMADLSWADLDCADLRGTNLTKANFRKTNLCGTNLIEASIILTNFMAVDLSCVSGLDKANHLGPSYVDIHTLYKSKGNIPESFLRGCGVPDSLIEYLPSLTGKAIEYYSCFISYCSKDEAFAKRLYADLQNSGVRCWYAPEDMKIGDKIRPTIDNSIRIHDKLLIILSESSVASEWVEHEVEHALDLERQRKKSVLFPVRLDAAVMESDSGWSGSIKRSRHIGDFTQWKEHDAYQESFERLLRDLKTDDDL